MAEMITEVLDALGSGSASLRCDDVRKLLTRLGFEVRDGKQPEVKPVYMRNLLRVIEQHRESISRLLEEGDDEST